jgi:hypothetical protein
MMADTQLEMFYIQVVKMNKTTIARAAAAA